MDRRVTPPKRVTSPTRGPPSPCSQALTNIPGGGRRFWKQNQWNVSNVFADSLNPLVTAGKWRKNRIFHQFLFFWTSFRLMLKTSFARSRNLDLIFFGGGGGGRIYFDLSLSLSLRSSFPSSLAVLLPTLSSFFYMEVWVANFLGKGQI